MAKKRKKGGIFGLSSDLMQVGGGVLATMVINKFVGGYAHKKHHNPDPNINPDPNGAPDHPPAGNLSDDHMSDNPVMNAIEGISAKMGMPKGVVIHGAISVGSLLLAEKMPEYAGVLKTIAAIEAYQAITHHHGVRKAMGLHDEMHGVTLAAIEANFEQRISEYKERLEAIDGIEGLDGMEGITLAGSPYSQDGQRIAEIGEKNDVYGIGATQPFAFV